MDRKEIMTRADAEEEASWLQGQAEICHYLDNFIESMALRCVVELGIADSLNSVHSHTMTLSQIAAQIPSSSLDIDRLSRLMRFLCCRKVFSATVDKKNGEILYGLTNSSKWLLTKSSDSEQVISFAPLVLLATHPSALASWNCLSASIAQGGPCGFVRANNSTLYEFQSRDDEYKKVFGEGMTNSSRCVTKIVLKYYEDGFDNVGSIVDVGGRSGAAVAEIVKAHPHIKGVNFDLPHVVASAPEHPNVTHVGGDMFSAIPHAEAIFMKYILHNWGDKKCLQILKNCRNALAKGNRKGKLIILEPVLRVEGDHSLFDIAALRYDLKMMVLFGGGKERTEDEWKKLLTQGGFSQFKIIEIPSFLSIIEAY